jgi:hypothetical protein
LTLAVSGIRLQFSARRACLCVCRYGERVGGKGRDKERTGDDEEYRPFLPINLKSRLQASCNQYFETICVPGVKT